MTFPQIEKLQRECAKDKLIAEIELNAKAKAEKLSRVTDPATREKIILGYDSKISRLRQELQNLDQLCFAL
jgi:hypothetical protein